jgi:hypothetical protein
MIFRLISYEIIPAIAHGTIITTSGKMWSSINGIFSPALRRPKTDPESPNPNKQRVVAMIARTRATLGTIRRIIIFLVPNRER